MRGNHGEGQGDGGDWGEEEVSGNRRHTDRVSEELFHLGVFRRGKKDALS